MRPIEKVNLIGKIALVLQEKMTYSQIDILELIVEIMSLV